MSAVPCAVTALPLAVPVRNVTARHGTEDGDDVTPNLSACLPCTCVNMGFYAFSGLSVGCYIPLTAGSAWPKLRRIFANPHLQSAIDCGGPSVLYPTRHIFSAGASAATLDSTESAAGTAESVKDGDAVEESSGSSSGSNKHSRVELKSKLQLDVRIVRICPYGGGLPSSIRLYDFYEGEFLMNAMMHDFFRKLPGFDSDDDAPFTEAEHKLAQTAFERLFSQHAKIDALIFQFPVLEDQCIGARSDNFDCKQHMHVAELGEQMACAEQQLASFGFSLDEIRVCTNLRTG
jgi:hypothetical protein